jgi:hypothetical protein
MAQEITTTMALAPSIAEFVGSNSITVTERQMHVIQTLGQGLVITCMQHRVYGTDAIARLVVLGAETFCPKDSKMFRFASLVVYAHVLDGLKNRGIQPS